MNHSYVVVVFAVVVYFILSTLLYLVFSANLGRLSMPPSRHGTLSLTSLPKDGGVSSLVVHLESHPSSF